ncbi:MAG: DUF3486 family protein [Gammaproteobacteria bacterium]|nr:DUF3486 family protein [Gammaproteobacteria bacterium]
MPARDKISQLPAEVRAEIDRLLIQAGFSGYEDLEQTILAEQGLRIGKSSLHRYGQKLERRLTAIRASTEAARAIAEAAPDDADHRSAAVISLVQSELFEVLLSVQDASDEGMELAERVAILSSAAKNIAHLTNASIRQKKHVLEVREQVRKEAIAEAAAAMEQSAKLAGVSPETIKAIRRDLLGMAA